MSLDSRIKKLQETFELRAEIADLLWEVERCKEIEQDAIEKEDYEGAQAALKVFKRNQKLIKAKEKVLEKKETLLTKTNNDE